MRTKHTVEIEVEWNRHPAVPVDARYVRVLGVGFFVPMQTLMEADIEEPSR